MTLAKPWKPEAIARLLLGLLVCIYGGSLAGCVLRFWQVGGKASGRVFYPLAVVAMACLAITLVLLRRPMRLEQMLSRLTAVLAVCYSGFLVGLWAQKYGPTTDPSTGQMVVSILCSHGAGLLLVGRFLREHELDWTEAFGLGAGRRQAIALGLVAACLFLPMGWGIEQAAAWALNHLAPAAMKPEEQRAVHVLRTAASWGERGALGALTVFLVPVAEEVFFRGILYTMVKQAGFERLALWGTAGVFALIHFNLLTFLPLLALALVLTVLYERTGNLLAPIMAHSLFNALNFALLCWFSNS